MKTKILLLIFLCPLILFSVNAQTNIFPSTGAAGIGTTTPDASSLLEIKSTTKGLLIPRMTQAQRNAITTPATGLMIYQTNATPGFYYYGGGGWKAVAAKAWNLTGNAGTDSSINFIGTTDAHPLVFRVNNIKAAYLDYNAQKLNTAFGFKAMLVNSTGITNTTVGYTSLYSNTSGSYNAALGVDALYFNTTGNFNTALGTFALTNNYSGTGNVGVGLNALVYNGTGNNNTAMGTNVLYNNTTGSNNLAIGVSALYNSTKRNNLIAIGDSALYNNGIGAVNYFDGAYNTAVGSTTLYKNTTGYSNTALGYDALDSNTAGIQNTGIGTGALQYNTTGTNNTAVAPYALYKNTTGGNNVAIGEQSLASNTTGNNNAAIGSLALASNTIGYSNIAIGYNTLHLNKTQSNLVAIGDSAMSNNSSGSFNTAVGSKTLYGNTSGSNNAANGSYSLYSNTTGSSNTGMGNNSLYKNTYGSNLVAVGTSALYNNGTGAVQSYDGVSNTAIGSSSLNANTIGYNNTASGYESLGGNTTGYNNSAYGVQALQSNVNGIGNTAIGVAADVNAGGLQNATAIGYYAKATASNQIMLGSLAVTSVEAAGSYVVYSDGRFKKNIKDNTHGLDFINLLNPVTYNYDIHKLNAYITPQTNKNDTINAKEKNDIEQGIKNKESILYSGFIAQDVESAAKKIGYDFSGIHKPQNDKDPYGLSYSDFVVPLVKAVQELSAMNDAKDVRIDTLQKQNANLQKQFNDLRTLVLSIQQQQQSCNPCSAAAATNASATQSYLTLSDGALLEQNIPNPFSNTTKINYTLPQRFSNAQIVITDKNGNTLKAINLPAGKQGILGNGKGSLNVDASTLSSGAYQYSLIVDGRLIDTKQMVLTK